MSFVLIRAHELRLPTTSAISFRENPAPFWFPNSVEDIVKIVGFARRHGLRVAMNGQSGTPDLRSRFGVQADNMLALTVVTGEGNLVTCSPTQSPNLFHAVLAGVGQCGIIVGAKIRLIAAETMAMVFNLFYDNVSLYLQDQLTLLADRRFNYLEGQIVRNATDTGWRYMIEAAAYFTPRAVPNSVALLAGLHDSRPAAHITPQTYRDFAFRIDPIVGFLKAIGRWTTSHP